MGISSARAQEPIRLLFTMTVDGMRVASPEMRVPPGREGRIVLNDDSGDLQRFEGLDETITFSPAVRGNDIAVTFEITSADTRIRPTLRISRSVPGTLEWTSATGAHAIRLAVTWIQ